MKHFKIKDNYLLLKNGGRLLNLLIMKKVFLLEK